jgi:hypothetical protein
MNFVLKTDTFITFEQLETLIGPHWKPIVSHRWLPPGEGTVFRFLASSTVLSSSSI